MLEIYNSLTRKQEVFQPLDPKNVRIYVCGMTVYDFCHIGHARVLVVFDVVSATAAVYDREVDGRVLNFRLETPGGLTEARLVDKETGTVWSAFTGEALEGPLAGTQLERVKSTSSFWFGWKDWYPETSVYGVDA